MRKIILASLISLPSLLIAQNWRVDSVAVLTVNPDSCTPLNIDVRAFMGCINFTVGAGTFNVNGNNINLQVHCTSSFICAGAISYPVTAFSLTGLNPGTYTITAEAFLDRVLTNSMSGGTVTIASCNTVSLEENVLSNISIYPNPTSEKLFIDEIVGNRESLRIQLFDITGKVQTIPMSTSNSRLQLDLSRLDAGIYFLQLTEGDQKLIKKILVD